LIKSYDKSSLEDGSHQENVWGADWYPESRKVGFGALINIRPQHGNLKMEIEDSRLRERIETIVRTLLESDV
jgi:hypothetical protein